MGGDTAGPLRVGLIGYPLGHSISPAFQQAALDACGIRAQYQLWPTPPEEVPAVIASLREPGVLGCNVTVPHKEAVIPLVDEIAPVVAQLGAANTIIRQPDGRLRAENTDLFGFERALSVAGVDVSGHDVVVLGAGGAARAVLLALDQLGARHITVANRHLERAARIIEELGLGPHVEPAPLDAAELAPHLAGAALIVNATSLGWHGDETPLDPALLPAGATVYDLTYRSTALLRAARARGLVALDGLTMLVFQGARSFELWTDCPAPIDTMMAAAQRAVASRDQG